MLCFPTPTPHAHINANAAVTFVQRRDASVRVQDSVCTWKIDAQLRVGTTKGAHKSKRKGRQGNRNRKWNPRSLGVKHGLHGHYARLQHVPCGCLGLCGTATHDRHPLLLQLPNKGLHALVIHT